MPPRKQPPQ
jgi:hypothetical protein